MDQAWKGVPFGSRNLHTDAHDRILEAAHDAGSFLAIVCGGVTGVLLLQLGMASLALYSAVDPQARRAARCNTRPDAAQHVSDTLRRPLLSLSVARSVLCQFAFGQRLVYFVTCVQPLVFFFFKKKKQSDASNECRDRHVEAITFQDTMCLGPVSQPCELSLAPDQF